MRRACIVTICALALGVPGLLSLSPSSPVSAAQPSAGTDAGPLLTLDVSAAPLKDVLQLLMKESGIGIAFPTNDQMSTPVSVTLKDKPLDSILRTVTLTAGVKLARLADGTYIVGADVPDQVSEPTAPTFDTSPVLQPEPQPLVVAPEPKPRKHFEKIVLHNINSKMAMISIGALPAGEATDPTARATPWAGGSLDVFRGKWGPKVDIINPGNDPVRIVDQPQQQPIYINASPVPPAAPTTDSVNSQVANRAADPAQTANQVVRPPFNRGSTTTTRPGTTTSPAQPGTGTTTTGTGTDNLRPDGIDAIIPLDQENALLVKGEDDAIQELKDLITLVDLPPKQVMIKAEFVEVSTSESRRLGLDWLLSRPNYLLQTDFRPSGNVIGYVQSGNLTANLRAELTTDTGKIVNAPIISTLNNTAATLSVGRQIPFYQSVTTVGNTGPPVTSSQVTYIDASTQLNILPQINGDNSITLIMQPQVQNTAGFVTGPNGEQAPIINQQTLSTARRVANGETIVVGGFIQKNDTSGGSRVPILGDLPLIGGLFRSRFNLNQDTETLIFITPTVVEERQTSGGVGVISP